jgi:hypothetical protein
MRFLENIFSIAISFSWFEWDGKQTERQSVLRESIARESGNAYVFYFRVGIRSPQQYVPLPYMNGGATKRCDSRPRESRSLI